MLTALNVYQSTCFKFFLRAILDANIVKYVCNVFKDEFLHCGKALVPKAK